MVLQLGTRLGPYEIRSAIGAGGMGEVYRAHDTKLHRDVAIKVLPEALAHDSERLARFEREARTLASLNHPNIAQIHGLEESDGTKALVMELVEGPTLAGRIAHGPIPVDEALPIARQIAEALKAAHEQGIVHRDLKPANVKLRPDGVVKVLDFGLAKALEPVSMRGVDATASPTITSPAMTQMGVILGTAAYMSPEQARGRPVDRRSDIWAFGCVLYEMLTGKRAFDGEDVTDMLGAVVRLEPDLAVLPANVPQPIRTLLHSCLVKDPRHRIADISTALFVLDKMGSLTAGREDLAKASDDVIHGRRWRLAAAAVAIAVVAGAAAGSGVWVATRPDPLRQTRFVLSGPTSAQVAVGDLDIDLAISRDGTRVAYVSGPQRQIYVRAIDRLEATPLNGTDNASGPFFSPDGNWIGFLRFVGGRDWVLQKIPVLGGAPVTLAALPSAGSTAGASWGSDDGIVLSGRTLVRVPAKGGEPVPLTSSAVSGHSFPEILPGGRAVLFTAGVLSGGPPNVSVLDLETHEERVLIRGGGTASYSPTGHIVYGGVDGTLRAVPFDLDRREVTGDPVPVLEGVMTQNGITHFRLAADGSLVYIAGRPGVDVQRTIVTVDREGRETPLAGIQPGAYRDLRISPDGARVAVASNDDVFTYDVARATLTRLTTHPAGDRSPLWTPDGDWIVFTSERSESAQLFRRRSDGSGDEERVLTRGNFDLLADGWSPDRKHMLFTEVPESLRCAIGQIPTTGAAEVTMLVRSEFCSMYAALSPNGRWLAYHSSRSGREEIHVERYPELGGLQQISTSGGKLPIWSKDGRELVFSSLDGRQMLAVPVRSGTTLAAGQPTVLFEGRYLAVNYGVRPYDLFPDGRFVMIKLAAATGDNAAPPRLVVVQNWQEELKRLVPTN